MANKYRYDIPLTAMINEALGKMGYVLFETEYHADYWLKHRAKPWMFISGVVPEKANYRLWDDRIYKNTCKPYGEY